jgi:chromosome segregation ATPase
MNEITTMRTKLGNKKIALGKDHDKVASLDKQIAIYENAKTRTESAISLKESEIVTMHNLIREYADLEKTKSDLMTEMKALTDQYNAIPWRPDLTPEEKIENSEYPELEAKLFEATSRLSEIPGELNRVYYRRTAG